MDGWVGGWVDGWKDGWMDGWMEDGWKVDGWRVDRWRMDGWRVDGWMDAVIQLCRSAIENIWGKGTKGLKIQHNHYTLYGTYMRPAVI